MQIYFNKVKSFVIIINVQWVSAELVFHVIFQVYDALLNFKKELKTCFYGGQRAPLQ